MRGAANLVAQSVGIVDGVSPHTHTDESAKTLVLYGPGGREVHRENVALRPGKPNDIRF